MKTLQEFIDNWDSKHGIDPGALITAEHLLEIANAWLRQPNGGMGSGYWNDHAPAASLYVFLETYVNGTARKEVTKEEFLKEGEK